MFTACQPALAANPFDIWFGGGSDDNWSTRGNWAYGVPANNGGTDIILALPSVLVSNVDAPWSVNSLTFGYAVGSATLTGQQLTIGPGGITAGTGGIGDDTISNPVVLAADQTWNTMRLTVTGPVSGPGGLTINSANPEQAVVTLAADTPSTFTGPINVLSGPLILDNPNGSAYAGNVINIGTGAPHPFGGGESVALEAPNQISAPTTLDVNIQSDGFFSVINDGIHNLTMTGGHVNGGALTINGNVTTLASSAQAVITANIQFPSSNPAPLLTVAQGSAFNGVDLDITGSITGQKFFKFGPGTLQLAGANSAAVILKEGTIVVANNSSIGPAGLTAYGGTIQADATPRTVDKVILAGGGPPGGSQGTLTVSGSGDLTFPTILAPVGGGLIKTGSGTLHLPNPAFAIFDVQLLDGTLAIGNNSAIPFGGSFTMGGGSVAAEGGPITLSNSVSLTGNSGVSGANDFTFSGGFSRIAPDGDHTMLITNTGLTTFSTTIALGGHTLTFDGPGNTLFNGPITGMGGLVKDGLGTMTLNLSGANSFGLTINAGTAVLNSGTMNGDIFNGTTFDYNGGTIAGRLTNAGTTNYSIDLTAGNGMENDSTFTIPAGRIVTLNGAGLDNEGQLSLTGGTLVLGTGSSHVNRGNLSVPSGSTVNLASGATFTNNATLSLAGGIVTGPSGTLVNGFGGVLSGTGTITSGFSNAGGTFAPIGGTINVTHAFTNGGSIQLTGVTSNVAGGAITNTGTIQGFGSVSNAVANTGTVEAIGGILNLAGALSNQAGGLIAAGIGSTVFIPAGLSSNAGIIDLTGGTFDNNGQPLNNMGQFVGYGTLRTGGSGFDNNGTVSLTGGSSTINGDLVNESGRTITVTGNSALFTGNVTNNAGATIITHSATLTFAGMFTNNGTVISDPSDHYFSNVQIGSTGALVAGSGDRMFVSGNFLSSSTNNTAWNTTAAELLMVGHGAQIYGVTGADLGASRFGYQNNFAWGTMSLAAGASLDLTGGDAQHHGAVYVGALLLGGGVSQVSSIEGNGLSIYYEANNPANAYLADHTFALAGGGQLAPVSAPLPGDANSDGVVNGLDISLIASHWLATGPAGDVTGDGIVNGLDIALVASHWSSPIGGSSAVAAPVPEPATIVLAALGMIALLAYRRQSKRGVMQAATLLLALLAGTNPARAVTIDWTAVGNPGNPADPLGGRGSVGYSFNIDKYDVTDNQYVELLNAKDPTGANALGLYNSNMSNTGDGYLDGGISYSPAAPNGAKYSVIPGDGNRPVNWVNWFDAIRFANWLNNGQGNGDTETGAYTLGPLRPDGIPTNFGAGITRNPGATVFLPSTVEWYKAAYYNPATSSYFQFPTSSNTAPTATYPTATPNSANYHGVGMELPPVFSLTDVGAYSGTTSPYGAFDMAGNVWQWNDGPGVFPKLTGGSFVTSAGDFNSMFGVGSPGAPGYEKFDFGFRVASIPEPSTTVLAAFGMIALLAYKRTRS